MDRTIIVFLIISSMSSQLLQAQTPDPYLNDTGKAETLKGYQLVWQDEFNKDGRPDTSNWAYESGFVRNEELQWYQPDNARCMHGSLVIEGKREKIRNPGYQQGSVNWKLSRPFASFSSASLHTGRHRQWKFGRFEVRARIDTALGSWPAIWTLGAAKEWPANGEIDIMEFYRIKKLPAILANLAWGTGKPFVAKWHTETRPLTDITRQDTNWCRKFHLWQMDWNKDSITTSLDGMIINTTLLRETIDPDGFNPFLQPHYLLLNLALGGNGGEPSPATVRIRYEVDYVRVYQETSGGSVSR